MRSRVAQVLGVAGVAASMCGLVLAASPTANATPLDDQNGTITGDRAKYGGACPPLRFNPTLESMAQDAVAAFEGADVGLFGGKYGVTAANPDGGRYNGESRFFVGYGGRQAAALNQAYKAGAGPALSDCGFTEYGSGFARSNGEDAVMIIFGKPAG